MDLARMLGALRREVQLVFEGLHGHQAKGLAEASWAMIAVGHCQLSRMALCGRGRATVPSCERRWQRLVANPRLDSERLMADWARAALADVGRVTLILDETPNRNNLRAMKISRQIHGRAIPIQWSCYKPDALPMPQNEIVMSLLERTAQALPAGAEATLLADRGLSWPSVLDFCVRHGWHYVLRVQGQTRVLLDDGSQVPISSLVSGPGSTWCGSATVFKKAGWRATNLVAHHSANAKEPWLLISDLPASRRRCQQYAKRMRIEESFRDEKSSGFRWNESRVHDPQHATRLLLLMAIAMRQLIRLGLGLIRKGKRQQLERQDRRIYSVFQLGLRYVQYRSLIAHIPP